MAEVVHTTALMHRVLVLLSLIWAAPASAAEPAAIEIWERPAGQYAYNDGPSPTAVVTVDRKALKLVESKRQDAQYGRALNYRGIELAKLITQAKPSAAVDLALLRFRNGMMIPVRLDALATLDPFVAYEFEESGSGEWLSEFPFVRESDDEYADARPIEFAGNKVVVVSPAHPMVAKELQESFSPWVHADSLKTIELVNSKAWYGQYAVAGGADVKQGLDVFRGTCQFCHGARNVGARYGWDFVDPVPIVEHRPSAKRLLLHVKFRAADAADRGVRMPALAKMTEAQASLLMAWLKAIATGDMPPYKH